MLLEAFPALLVLGAAYLIWGQLAHAKRYGRKVIQDYSRLDNMMREVREKKEEERRLEIEGETAMDIVL